ncbi:cell division protein ZipA C-terminal FtsZ-binding domain-containing protein [Lamprobacter modestohalophilus]|uniref:cell division protein ZipA C-terminal FtsZ-binding domain-containing protein n=1 Tax=Lamprobacter modestohalophilus TaxID=1064514 RepID=UPI002ADEB70A|nr:cell division protein ZipA C-terminal FtsZ-binding domain-containing protein [Lamprobacter modestohalophilus]MEA1050056.1 cell division protein ZipA C-terminal FtsZ-binding domain-containing protein [Lamprobacter modestohalophilus]
MEEGACFCDTTSAVEEQPMNNSSLAILLAAAALILGLGALAIFYLSILRQKDESDATETETDAPPERAASAESDPAQSRGRGKKKLADKTQRYLFVVFDEPGPETNRALGQLLKETKAFYEAALGIYHIPPGPEGYPLTVANASSPGTLPPLHLNDGEQHPPVQGVSILIKFINSRSLSRSPDTMIAFTRRAADIGGRILDVERNPVTEETLAGIHPDAD